jgi:hypothetical protein
MSKETPDFIEVIDDAIDPEVAKIAIEEFEKVGELGVIINRQDKEGSYSGDKDDHSLNYFENVLMGNLSGKTMQHMMEQITLNVEAYINKYSTGFFGRKGFEGESLIVHEGANLQVTRPGQGYHVWHCENNGGATGARCISWLLYLNDIEDGGETEFIHYGKRIKPKAGRLVLFPAGFTHTHRGNPPLEEAKYIGAGWIKYKDGLSY